MPKPITGGWRVLIGTAVAGTLFLIVKPNLKSDQLLLWSLACGSVGATVAWGLEL